MKIAICLSGQPRSIEFTYKSILNYFTGDYEVDYFCHVWDYNTWKLQTLKFSDIEKIDRNWLEIQLKNFNPKAYIIGSANDLNRAGGRYVYYGSLTYSYMLANHLKKIYELENNFRYDFVVKARFDSIFDPSLKFVPVNDQDQRKIYVPHLGRIPYEYNRLNASDCLFYGDSWGMDILSDMFRHIKHKQKQINVEDDPDLIGPGSTAFTYLSSFNTRVAATPGNFPEIFYRKEALGLDSIEDFDKIAKIHASFYQPQ